MVKIEFFDSDFGGGGGVEQDLYLKATFAIRRKASGNLIVVRVPSLAHFLSLAFAPPRIPVSPNKTEESPTNMIICRVVVIDKGECKGRREEVCACVCVRVPVQGGGK